MSELKKAMYLCQFIDLDTSQRSEPWAIDADKLSETMNAAEDYVKQFEQVRNLGVLVVSEHTQVEEDGKIVSSAQPSKAPIMKFEQFKTVMEQRYAKV